MPPTKNRVKAEGLYRGEWSFGFKGGATLEEAS